EESRHGDYVPDLDVVAEQPGQAAAQGRRGPEERVRAEYAGRQDAAVPLQLDDRGRVVGERADQGLVDEPDRGVVADARGTVVTHIPVGQDGPVFVRVHSLQGVGDVRLGHEVAEHVGQVALVGRDRGGGGDEPGGDPLGKLVDQ